ncbi:MAG: hypothetical protein KW806_01350 [Candidatus Yanofskybacteria bacterium]|nr:hypothetical protein [Candidatus Yanofskybacteria bacterium]
MVTNILTKIRDFVKQHYFELFVLACIICIAVISYNIGQMHALKKTPVKIGENAAILQALGAQSDQKALILEAGAATSKLTPVPPRDQRVVVSKSGKVYHFSWCSGAKRIKPENQIWFESEALAQQAGYTLAGNCQ